MDVMEFCYGDPEQDYPEYDLKQLEEAGIDTSEGMLFCASDEEIYYEALNTYVTSGDNKIRLLCDHFRDRNWKEYEIIVHAAKSNSKTIGAKDMFEKAYALERAAERGDEEFIMHNHDDFTASYNRIAQVIKDACITDSPREG